MAYYSLLENAKLRDVWMLHPLVLDETVWFVSKGRLNNHCLSVNQLISFATASTQIFFSVFQDLLFGTI